MTGNMTDAVRHDVQALARDLALYLKTVRGGTLAANEEIAADYLIAVMGVKDTPETVTTRLMFGVRMYAEHRKGNDEQAT